LLILAEQDRTLWDGEMIADGLRYFRESASGAEVSNYHLEAEIASYHILSKNFKSTDWKSLVAVYQELLKRKPSPIVALNKAIALSQIEGASVALLELKALKEKGLDNYYPFYITKGHLLQKTADHAAAIKAYESALRLTDNESIKRFVKAKIDSFSYCDT